jgi:hypothetical protein
METIVCSAIHYKNLPTPTYLPANINKGLVVCGLRHVYCLHQVVALTGKRQAELGPYTEGFLTSENRFVDRKEGAIIALSSGQIKKTTYSKTDLYSEDLF